jgi:transglutaminase-like putative cysteine protease
MSLSTSSNVPQNSPVSQEYLHAAFFIDSDQPAIIEFAEANISAGQDDIARAISLYLAVRDGITYDPYFIGPEKSYFRASDCLKNKRGFCIPKSALMVAACRVVGIPARIGFADVKNHLSTPKLDKLVGSNIYLWHSYAEIYLEGQWVKATPAFNKSLCERFGVHTLEFDGRQDSLFQEFDLSGHRHMDYINQHGHFSDVPYEIIVKEFAQHHSGWLYNRQEKQSESWD